VNPLDWSAPTFLLVYLAWGVGVLLLERAWRRAAERGDGPRPTLSDPYLIACLRGGPAAALRVALFALCDRGLLRLAQGKVTRRDGVSADALRRPLEKELVEHFSAPRDWRALLDGAYTGTAVEGLEETLRRHGLLPGEAERAQRAGRRLLLLALLLAPALLRFFAALAHGRSNVLFLVLLAVGFMLLLMHAAAPRRTAKGDALLGDLRTLFAGLRGRAASLAPGGATAEAALLAAVFGLSALPAAAFGVLRRELGAPERRREFADWSAASNTSCGSSCGALGLSSHGDSSHGPSSDGGGASDGGASCGSSCGGGCGGGGCGG
jgi:uncharacterized protein (TIGR04222 family)